LTPPKGGEKQKGNDNTSAGKRCVDTRDVSAALNARDGKKARVTSPKREKRRMMMWLFSPTGRKQKRCRNCFKERALSGNR